MKTKFKATVYVILVAFIPGGIPIVLLIETIKRWQKSRNQEKDTNMKNFY